MQRGGPFESDKYLSASSVAAAILWVVLAPRRVRHRIRAEADAALIRRRRRAVSIPEPARPRPDHPSAETSTTDGLAGRRECLRTPVMLLDGA